MDIELRSNKILLSIIVPIYNVEEYLQMCVDSILSQTFTDYELILVDDGSTDGCGAICDEYVKNNSNVKVIHQKNGGLVRARKTGVEHAGGEFVAFVDGDDWIAPDYYEKLINNAISLNESFNELPDIVCGGFISAFSDKQTVSYDGFEEKWYKGKELEILQQHFLFTGMGRYHCIHPAIWSKLIRRELLVKAQTHISDEIRMGEDVIATAICISNASSLAIVKKNAGYYYRQNNTSMSHTPDWSYFPRINRLFDGMESALPNIYETKEIAERYSCYKTYMFRCGIYRLLDCKVSLKRLYTETMRAYLDLKIDQALPLFSFEGLPVKDKQELCTLKTGKIRLYILTVKLRELIRNIRHFLMRY